MRWKKWGIRCHKRQRNPVSSFVRTVSSFVRTVSSVVRTVSSVVRTVSSVLWKWFGFAAYNLEQTTVWFRDCLKSVAAKCNILTWGTQPKKIEEVIYSLLLRGMFFIFFGVAQPYVRCSFVIRHLHQQSWPHWGLHGNRTAQNSVPTYLFQVIVLSTPAPECIGEDIDLAKLLHRESTYATEELAIRESVKQRTHKTQKK